MTKILKLLVSNPVSILGLAIVITFVGVAAAAPWLAPCSGRTNPYEIPREGFSGIPLPPSDKHPFGTTQGQYDIYYGVIWGTRTAFRVGLIVTSSVALLGVALGTIAGYFGGVVDEMIMRVVDVFMAFPYLVAAMAVAAILGKGLDKVMLAMVVFGWMPYARLIRSAVLSVKLNCYIEASRAIGLNDVRIILKHVLPNTIQPVFVMASMDIGSMVLWASTLSFLGLGGEPGYADWGQLISVARNWIIGPAGDPFRYWYTVIYPGGAILFFVLGWNLLGDAFRDILDPRIRGIH